MATEATTFTAGSLFCFSTGEYSDYGYQGHFVALEDITRERLAEIVHEVKTEHKRLDLIQDEWVSVEVTGTTYPWVPGIHEMFIAAVIKAGLVMPVTCSELHIGSYGELDVES